MHSSIDGIELRDATVDDATGIARVYVETWRETYANILPAEYLAKLSVARLRTSWSRKLKTNDDVVIVAVCDGEVIGFCSGGTEESGDAFFRGEIFTLYVRPGRQRRGVGGDLLVVMLKRLRHKAPVLVWVLKENEGAQRFYSGLGAIPVRAGTHTVGGRIVDKIAYAFFDT